MLVADSRARTCVPHCFHGRLLMNETKIDGAAAVESIAQAGSDLDTSPGKQQCLWLLCPTTEVWSLLALQERYGADKHCRGSVCQVMRVAGFRHMKNWGAPHMVRIVHAAKVHSIAKIDWLAPDSPWGCAAAIMGILCRGVLSMVRVSFSSTQLSQRHSSSMRQWRESHFEKLLRRRCKSPELSRRPFSRLHLPC